jgi:DNA polymerase-3 subunit beta
MAYHSFVHTGLAGLLEKRGALHIRKSNVAEMEKWLGRGDIDLNMDETHFYMRGAENNDSFAMTHLAGGGYPDYYVFLSRLSQPDVSRAVVNRAEFLDALGRIRVFLPGLAPSVHMLFTDTEVRLKTTDMPGEGFASVKIAVDFKGDARNVFFHGHHLHNILGHFVSEVVELTITGQESVCGIKGRDEPDYTVLIMPMRVYKTD